MPPIKEFVCKDCLHDFEEILFTSDTKPQCPECNSLEVKPVVTAHGGYTMNSGGSSTRPKGAGSFKKRGSK